MAAARLGDDLAYPFMGALLSIARIDRAISIDEGRVLREIASELMSEEFDFEQALMSTGSVTAFARVVKGTGDSPFRGAGGQSPEEIADLFVGAARRLATADDGKSGREEELIAQFLDALGLPPR